MRVLVVDDEEDLADALRTALQRAAIAADVAYDGDAALAQLAVNDYDAVILDRDLPGVSGDEVCRAIAGRHLPARVLMPRGGSTRRWRVSSWALTTTSPSPSSCRS
jgi:two-component system, OmpR family, response regulator VanR